MLSIMGERERTQVGIIVHMAINNTHCDNKDENRAQNKGSNYSLQLASVTKLKYPIGSTRKAQCSKKEKTRQEKADSCKEEEDSIESAKNLEGSGTYQVVKETWPLYIWL